MNQSMEDIEEREMYERMNTDTKQALTAQMNDKKRHVVEEKVVEAGFRKMAEERMLTEDIQERKEEAAKEKEGRVFSQQLLEQIAGNTKRRAKDDAVEEARAQQVWDCNKGWRTEVSEERQKIVMENAPPPLGYLQAGDLKKDDLPAVRERANMKEELANLDKESMAISNRPPRFSKCNAQCRILREY